MLRSRGGGRPAAAAERIEHGPLAVTVGLAVSVVPILLRVLPPLDIA